MRCLVLFAHYDNNYRFNIAPSLDRISEYVRYIKYLVDLSTTAIIINITKTIEYTFCKHLKHLKRNLLVETKRK